jgi:polysaccharide biosynthesis/export protein
METIRNLIHPGPLALLAWLALSTVSTPLGAQAMREVLGAGDTIRITAYRYPELTTETRLSEQGRVTVPMIGEVTLQGMTPDQAGRHIAERLTRGNYMRNPQIGVTVVQARSRQVSVLGYVTRPGRYVLDGTTARLTDVIALAGGLQPGAADVVTVQLHRNGKSESVEVDLSSIMAGGDATKNIEVASGDSVFVPRAPVFYILGQVERPGLYRLEPDMTVMQAISVAGGVTLRGTDRRPQLRRRGPDGEWTRSTVDLLDSVAADDVIYIRESLF